jgi:hypothetical protein
MKKRNLNLFRLCWCSKLPVTSSFSYWFGNFDTNKLATRFVGVEKCRLVFSTHFFTPQALSEHQQRRNNSIIQWRKPRPDTHFIGRTTSKQWGSTVFCL